MYRVIVVEDEVLVREAICENINWNGLGYELAGNCENGKSAIEFLEETEVDVVLTDICMPYMDGMQLSEYIHQNTPDVRVIIFSGFDEFEYAKKAIQYHVEDYLLKPVTAFELSEVLTKLKEKMDEERRQKNKVSRINKVYHKNELYLKSNVLLNLIQGRQSESELEREMREVGIRLEYQAYRVAVIWIVQNGVEPEREEEKKQSALMNFVVYNIADEIVAKTDAGIVFMGNENHVYLLFHTNKPKEFLQVPNDVCEEIMDTVFKTTKLKLVIGIGEYVTLIGTMSRSTESAKQGIAYGMKFSDRKPVDMELLQGKIQESVDIIPEIDELGLAIKLGDHEKINQSIEEAIWKIKAAYIEPAKVAIYAQQLAQVALELMKIMESKEPELDRKKEDLLYKMATSISVEEMAGELKSFCTALSVGLSDQKNVGQKKYAVIAMDYLEKNYDNPNLSLNFMCNYLGISISRFSSVFKSSYQETFMESLIRIRMQKARELIEHTDLKNYEIADKVGFTDPHYFSISFKKATGKTPKEYAREMR